MQVEPTAPAFGAFWPWVSPAADRPRLGDRPRLDAERRWPLRILPGKVRWERQAARALGRAAL